MHTTESHALAKKVRINKTEDGREGAKVVVPRAPAEGGNVCSC